MKILILDGYFQPEQIAFTHLEHDLLERFVEDGNEVQVICPIPTRGIDETVVQQYRHKKSESLYGGKVQVTRFWAPQEGANPLLRAFRYFWCNMRTYQIGKRKKGCDLVFCNSTPPTQGWIAGKVARRLKTPFIYSLQDIFPDSMVAGGLSKNESLLWKIGRKLEDSTYAGCTRIVAITRAMKENLLNKGVADEKIEVIGNWIDTDRIKPVNRAENPLFDEFGVDRSKYVVLYAGNFGEAQGAEIVLDAAEKLQDDPEIQFVIFGGGARYERAAERAKQLKNVFIHPLLPQSRIAEVYSMGDAALVTCKRGFGKSGMPSKTWNIMACGTPLIASFDQDSELCEMIRAEDAGICAEPEDADAVAKAVLTLKKDRGKAMGTRAAVIRIASKEPCTSAYLRLFHEAIKNA